VVLNVESYDPVERLLTVNSRGGSSPMFTSPQAAKWVSHIPTSDSGAGHFINPPKNTAVLCICEYTYNENDNEEEPQNVFALGFPEMESGSKIADPSQLNPTPGDEVIKYESGLTRMVSSLGFEKLIGAPWAQRTIIPLAGTIKNVWQNTIETMRGGLKHWEWDRENDNVSYVKTITESYVSMDNSDHHDLPGEEPETLFDNDDGSRAYYKNKIIFKGGALVEGANSDEAKSELGAIVVGEDAGANFITTSKQKAVPNSTETTPKQFVKSVIGRVTGAAQQLFRFKAWDKEGVSNLDVLVNKGGVDSVHGVNIEHKQTAGDVTISISQDAAVGVKFAINKGDSKIADFLINYNGEIVLNSNKVHLGGLADEKAVLGNKLQDALKDLVDQLESAVWRTTQGTTVGLLNPAQFDSVKSALEDILSENVKCL
jgi:hypothetical protein